MRRTRVNIARTATTPDCLVAFYINSYIMDRNERLDKRQADTSPYCIKVTIFSFIKTAEKAKYCLRCHQFPTICARYQKLVGIKNIHIGPTLPAFVSPELLQTLPSAFGLGTITTVDDDIKTMVG